jgi:cell division protein YceG involved in septum cleavage
MASKVTGKGRKTLVVAGLIVIIAVTSVFLLPQLMLFVSRDGQEKEVVIPEPAVQNSNAFPISVNPAKKEIVVNAQANAYFNEHDSGLTASVGNFSEILGWIASLINNTSLYQSVASADGRLVTILPGYRKEQVADVFGSALGWNTRKEDDFLADVELDAAHDAATTSEITEGVFQPGTYAVLNGTTPADAAELVATSFDSTILSHYSTSTQAQVPLSEALTVASLLEREAAGPTDMRIISGIIWNRLFNNMNLQIDATLQYAKVNKNGDVADNWWPAVVPKDKYITSAYNTYEHPGLPPGPIANPSVAAVLAALNPVPTSCLYYFHDSNGNFHCSDTYAEHVALLKQYYGQGK